MHATVNEPQYGNQARNCWLSRNKYCLNQARKGEG